MVLKKYTYKNRNKNKYKDKNKKGKGFRTRVIIHENPDGSTTFFNKNGNFVRRFVGNKKEIDDAIKALNQSTSHSSKKTRKKRLIKFLNKFNFMRKRSKKKPPVFIKKDFSFDKEMDKLRESLAKPMFT